MGGGLLTSRNPARGGVGHLVRTFVDSRCDSRCDNPDGPHRTFSATNIPPRFGRGWGRGSHYLYTCVKGNVPTTNNQRASFVKTVNDLFVCSPTLPSKKECTLLHAQPSGLHVQRRFRHVVSLVGGGVAAGQGATDPEHRPSTEADGLRRRHERHREPAVVGGPCSWDHSACLQLQAL